MSLVIPFHITDWQSMPATKHAGESGYALWRTLQLGDVRLRIVQYSAGYQADHWCELGHIIYCIDGQMVTELSDGRLHQLNQGQSYQVSDGQSSHRSFSQEGCTLFIVDGGFLANKGPA